MRKVVAIAAGALATTPLLAIAAPAAQAQGAQLNFVHAMTYDFPTEPFPLTLCVDDVVIDSDVVVGEVISIDVDAGTRNVEVFQGAVADCAAAPFQQLDTPVGAAEDVTVVGFWGETQGLTSFVNATACVQPGEARFSAFQAGDVSLANTTDVATGPAMTANLATLFTDLGSAEIATADITAEALDVLFVVPGADPNVGPYYGEVAGLDVTAGQAVVVFLAGGNDGESGAFSISTTLPECPPSTTTTAAPTTTTAAAAVVTPAFTG